LNHIEIGSGALWELAKGNSNEIPAIVPVLKTAPVSILPNASSPEKNLTTEDWHK
jgi:hypothetical protein